MGLSKDDKKNLKKVSEALKSGELKVSWCDGLLAYMRVEDEKGNEIVIANP